MCENCPSTEVRTFCTTCYKDKDCDVKINAACVYYHLYDDEPSNLECLGIPNKVSLEAILDEIDDKLCEFTSMQTPLTANDSTTINFNTSGTGNHTLTGSVIIDPDSDNILVATPDGLFVDGSGITSLLTFNNGLTKTGTLVQLGGNLVKNTTITNNSFNLQINGDNSSYSLFAPNKNIDYQSEGNTNSDLFTYKIQIPDYFKISGGLHTGSPSYHSAAFLKLDNDNRITLLGTDIPNSDDATPAPSSQLITAALFKTEPYKSRVEASENLIISPQRTITSGTPVSGKRYYIRDISGGADFTTSGASTNTVGEIFTANGVAPTWGSGMLELVGNILLSVPYTSTTIERSSQIITAYSSLSAPDDYGIINIKQPSYYENQIFTTTNRNDVSYLTEGTIVLRRNPTEGTMSAKIGVYTPTTNDALIPAPAEDPNQTALIEAVAALIRYYAKEHRVEGSLIVKAQGSGTAIASSAQFEVNSTTKGFMPPRMTTTQRNAISSPAAGLIIYNTSTNKHQGYNGSTWNDFY